MPLRTAALVATGASVPARLLAGLVLALCYAAALDELRPALGGATLAVSVLLVIGTGTLLGWAGALPVVVGVVAADAAAGARWSDTTPSIAAWGAGLLVLAGIASALGERRRRAVRELAVLQRQHRRVVEHVRDVLYETDAGGRWTFLSPAWTELTGHPAATSLGRPFADFVHPDDLPAVADLFRRLSAGEARDAQAEVRARTADGGYRWMLSTARARPGDDGRVAGVVGRLADVSEQREAEALLRRASEALARRDAVLAAIASAGRALLGPADVGQAVRHALEALGRGMNADRAYVFQFHASRAGEPVMSQRYEWCAPGVEPQIDNPDMLDIPVTAPTFAPWVRPLADGPGAILRPDELPDEARALLEAQDIRAFAVVPVRVEGRTWGLLGFDDCHGDRAWGDPEMDALRTGAEMLGAGLARAQSDARFRRVLEASPAAIYALTSRGGLPESEWYTPRPGRVLGIPQPPRPDFAWWMSIVHPDDLAALGDHTMAAPGREQTVTEYRVADGAGGWRWVRDEQRLLYAADPETVVVGSWIDITARKEAEEGLRRLTAQLEARVEERTIELRNANLTLAAEAEERRRILDRLEESERHFRSLIEHASDLTAVYDADGRVTYASPSVQRMLGWTPEQVVGRPFADFMHPDDLARADARMAELLAAPGGTIREPYRLRTADGRWCVVEVTSRNLLDDPAVRGVVANGRDVTEREEVLARLRRSERDYHGLFRNSQEAILIFEPAGEVVLDANPRACELYGRPRETLVGTSLRALSRDPERGRAFVEQVMETGEAVRFVSVQYTADGTELHLEVNASPVEYGGRTAILSSNRDVTERVRARRDLEHSLSLLRATLEATTDGILVLDHAGGLAHWNERFLRMWGLTAADLARGEADVVARAAALLDEPGALMAAARAVDADGEWNDVLRLRDGRVFERYSLPQRLDGRVVGRVWAFRDVTEAERAREERERSLSLVQATLESTADGILVVDRTGRMVSWNARFTELWGLPADVMALGDDDAAIAWAASLTRDPGAFDAGIRALHARPEAESLDLVPLRDGRIFERFSRPQRIGDALVGRVWSYRDITERMRSAEALRASEERFRQIADNIHQVFYMVEVEEDRVSYVSPAFEEIFGIPADTLLRDRHAWYDLLHPDDVERLREAAYAGTEGMELSYRITRPDGQLRWLRTRSVPVHDAEGRVYRVAGITEDVTERVLAEEAVRASEARFREIVSALSGVFYVIDIEPLRATYLSPGFAQVFGLGAAPVMDDIRLWVSLIHPDDQARVAAALAERGRPVDITYRIVHSDAGVRWIQTRNVPVADEDGVVRRAVGLSQDVTDRVTAEQAVRTSEARFREIAGALSGVFYMAELDPLRVTYVSPAFEQVFGRDPSELLADIRAWLRYVHPDDRDYVATHLGGTGEAVDLTYRVVRPDGDVRWVHSRGFPVTDEDGVVRRSVGMTEDVTERVRAEHALAASEERFREMAENIREVFYILDLDSNTLLYLSPAYEEVWGRPRDEAMRDPAAWARAVHPDDGAALWSRDEVTGVRESSYRIIRPDGEVRWIRSRGFPVRDAEGRVYRLAGLAEDVTDRLRAEEALRASEERFRQLAETVDEVFYIYDMRELRVLYVSPAYEKVWGRPVDEVLRDPGAWDAGVHPDDADRLARAMGSPGAEYEVEYRVVRPDGETRWVRGRGYPVRDAEGRVYREVGVAHDVTERVRAEEALRTSEERFRQLAETVGEVFYVYDIAQERMLYVSPAYAGIWGRAPDEVLRDPHAWLAAVHPDDAGRLARTMGSPGVEYEAEYRVVRPDGEVRWIHGRGYPVLDAEGRVYREVGVADDVTARKAAEEAIRQAERRAQHTAERMRAIAEAAAAVVGADSPRALQEALEEISAGVLRFDACFLLLYDEAAQTFSTVGGTDAGVPVPPGVSPAAGTPAERVVRERRTLVARRADDPAGAGAPVIGTGRRSQSVIRAPVLGARGVQGVLALHSYTPDLYTPEDVEVVEALAALAGTALENLRLAREKREAREALGDSQRQLLHSQKMEAVGRLAGGIAHDFNNMLMAIGGHAELLRGDPDLPPASRWQAEEIRKAADRAAGLTRQLLAFSRKQVLQPRSLSVNAVITDVEDMLRRLIGEDVRLRTSLSASVGVVRADPGQLEQVLMNLAVNARDAMPGGGTLTIETANVALDAPVAVDEDQVAPGRYVMLAVRDTGVGMDPGVRQRIFEPFFTTKPQGKGTGLGLSTVYGIVRQSGGHIRVESAPGQGTRFTIWLPREDAPHEVPAVAQARPPEQGSESVLLVEDDEVVRGLLAMFLRRLGYDVISAGGGDEALSLVEAAGAPPQLLLTDVVMPGMSGRELAGAVRARWPGVKVIYMSGYTNEAIDRHGVLDPGSEFIQKPVAPDVLAQRLREVLEGR
ncbi:PAS domain S-box protein [Longimicrobium sp.]|uniref:PAS domain S-box protein n=1 Tax=Longimicrobium sp. TaxID=2029185 RepID=UPI002E2EF60C|nr:PAS domain S-box protein [Longimicrobium sp.]HEX6039832.1 PAS domain S-box protein [Longimicrobium sp.]